MTARVYVNLPEGNDKNTQPQDAEKLRKPRQASEVSSPTCQEFLIVTERTLVT